LVTGSSPVGSIGKEGKEISVKTYFVKLLLINTYVGAIAILFLFAVMISETKMSIFKRYNKTFFTTIEAMFGVILLGGIFHTSHPLTLSYLGNTNVLINVVEFSGEIDAHNYGSVLYSYFAI
jgi:NADH:ubiquinone oxidoreductase subunit 6 (subunit J)